MEFEQNFACLNHRLFYVYSMTSNMHDWSSFFDLFLNQTTGDARTWSTFQLSEKWSKQIFKKFLDLISSRWFFLPFFLCREIYCSYLKIELTLWLWILQNSKADSYVQIVDLFYAYSSTSKILMPEGEQLNLGDEQLRQKSNLSQ